jgi:hypothetical protein
MLTWRVVVILSVASLLTACPFDFTAVDVIDGLAPGDGETGETGETGVPDVLDPAQPLPPVWSDVSPPSWADHLELIDGAVVGSPSQLLVLAGTPYDLPPRLLVTPIGEGPPPWSFDGAAKQDYAGLATAADGSIVVMARDWTGFPTHLRLARFSPHGQTLWSRQYLDLAGHEAIVTTADGAIVVLNDSPPQVHRFAADGSHLWTHAGAPGVEFTDLATDASGRLFVVGVVAHRLALLELAGDGEPVWSVEHLAPWPGIHSPALATTDGALVVAAGLSDPELGDFSDVAALASFDTAGAVQWWRLAPELHGAQVQARQLLPLPSGDLLVRWWIAGDDIGSTGLFRYDAEGTLLFEFMSESDHVLDVAVGNDDRIYTLQVDEWDEEAFVVPYPQ